VDTFAGLCYQTWSEKRLRGLVYRAHMHGMKITHQLKRSPVVALFVWLFLVSCIVLSLSEAKNTKNQMTFQNINHNIIYHNNKQISSSPSLLQEQSKNSRNNHQRQYSPSSRKHRKHHRKNNSSRSQKSQKNSLDKMDCHLNPDPVWIRNDCTDGFLAITSDRRVATLNSRVDQHDNLVKLRSESCTSRNASLWEPVRTRLFSESQNRYICFNHRGRLRSVPKRRARRLGNLCAFYERALPSRRHVTYSVASPPKTHFNLQSAHNPRWYMGFLKPGLKHIGLRYSPEGHPISLPRRMGRPAHKLVRPRTKCDFRFYSGIFTPKAAMPTEQGKEPATPSSPSWAGMMEKIELHKENKNSVRTRTSEKKSLRRRPEENSEIQNYQGAFKAVEQPLKGRINRKKGKRKMAFSSEKRPKYLSSNLV